MEQRYMNAKTAAHYLGISTSTLRMWRNELNLPCKEIAGMIRYDKVALDKFMSKNHINRIPY